MEFLILMVLSCFGMNVVVYPSFLRCSSSARTSVPGTGKGMGRCGGGIIVSYLTDSQTCRGIFLSGPRRRRKDEEIEIRPLKEAVNEATNTAAKGIGNGKRGASKIFPLTDRWLQEFG